MSRPKTENDEFGKEIWLTRAFLRRFTNEYSPMDYKLFYWDPRPSESKLQIVNRLKHMKDYYLYYKKASAVNIQTYERLKEELVNYDRNFWTL